MIVRLPYGEGQITAELPSHLDVIDVSTRAVQAPGDGRAMTENALDNPIGTDGGLFGNFAANDTVAIVVSDSFRKTGADEFLPTLLDRLASAGIRDENVLFCFATGVHRAPTSDEQRQILGASVFYRFRARLLVHDAFDESALVNIGTTSRGTPVEINKHVLGCDRIIATGTVVLHYFAGYGGGRKAIVPGLASARTIAHNHAMNLHPFEDRLDPAVRIAAIEGNPVAEDILEGARMVPVDFILNTILTPTGKIAAVVAGDLVAAHETACKLAYELYAVPLKKQADLVIAASPHTRNFVQTHKALYNAHLAVRPGGRVILAAPCREGLGGEGFAKWLRLGSVEAVYAGLRTQSEINGQTVLSTLGKSPTTFFVTELAESDVQLLRGQKARSLQAAVDSALEALGNARTCVLIPDAAYTVPVPAGATVSSH
jgi:nickel-dependent lactate racemase